MTPRRPTKKPLTDEGAARLARWGRLSMNADVKWLLDEHFDDHLAQKVHFIALEAPLDTVEAERKALKELEAFRENIKSRFREAKNALSS